MLIKVSYFDFFLTAVPLYSFIQLRRERQWGAELFVKGTNKMADFRVNRPVSWSKVRSWHAIYKITAPPHLLYKTPRKLKEWVTPKCIPFFLYQIWSWNTKMTCWRKCLLPKGFPSQCWGRRSHFFSIACFWGACKSGFGASESFCYKKVQIVQKVFNLASLS